jgi:hypothetical protein
MPKPAGFQLTVILLWFFAIAGVVVAFIPMAAVPAGLTAQSAAFAGRLQAPSAVIGALIAAVFIVFYSKGENWARWVIMVASVFYLIGGFVAIKMLSISPPKAYLSFAEALFAIYLLYYLNTAPVKAWFERKKLAV